MRVTTEFLRVLLNPRGGVSRVIDEVRKLHVGIEPVIRHYGDEAALRERRADEAIVGLTAPLPRAAVPEDHDRAAGG